MFFVFQLIYPVLCLQIRRVVTAQLAQTGVLRLEHVPQRVAATPTVLTTTSVATMGVVTSVSTLLVRVCFVLFMLAVVHYIECLYIVL